MPAAAPDPPIAPILYREVPLPMRYRVSSEPRDPTEASLRIIDQARGGVVPDDPGLAEWTERYAANHRRRLAFDVDLLEKHVRSDETVLEIGSTPPVFTVAATRLGARIIGVDLHPDRYANVAQRESLDLRRCDIEKEPLPVDDESVDVVVFNEVFEHLRINPIFTVEQMLRVLKPDGRLLMSTPNLRSANGLVNFLLRDRAYSCLPGVYEQYDKLRTLGHMGHVREYTATEVVEFLKHVGFRVEEVVFRGTFPSWRKRLIASVNASFRPVFTVVATPNPTRGSDQDG